MREGGETKVNELYGTWTVTHLGDGNGGFYSIETEFNKPVFGETVLSFSDGTYTMKGWFGDESGTLTEDGSVLTLSIGNTGKTQDNNIGVVIRSDGGYAYPP